MSLAGQPITAADVLQAFRRDAPDLFLGAAFMTVGLVSVGFSALRRIREPLLIYFGIFAGLYGLRLWLQASLTGLIVTDSALYARLIDAINYLVPIPFVLYLRAARLLLSRAGILVAYLLLFVESILTVAVFAFGPMPLYVRINNTLVIIALVVLIMDFVRKPPQQHEDIVTVRTGLLIFAGFALWDNVAQIYFPFRRKEPIGFAIFLACLGYVAARRTLHRDRQLSEIQKELEVAKRIQLSILPAEFPESPHFRVAARYLPMTSVAGDFYDYVVAENGRAGLLIADVSGHGVPAALIASMVKLAAAAQRSNASDAAQFLAGMNSALYGNTQNQFVTAAYVYLDSRARELRYSAAGHPPMLLLRSGQVVEVQENGLMLAMFDSASYVMATQRLEHGDRLLLYTDGLMEACNSVGEFFGREGLSEALKKTSGSPPAEAADLILSAVQKWSAAQDDDLTLIVCDFAGNDV
ncbi:MAG TPA: PP2C family protein-serine/threonine phosphatase [Bryobacteraceae bacterium]|jgi:sigma-B regulation protein RsbU (phosphoserine phosphatase)